MSEERWYDVYRETPASERKYYVYVWFERVGDEWFPFYVGEGSGSRVNNTYNRSRALRDYMAGKEIKRVVVASELPDSMARFVEHRVKEELRRRGYHIIDAEDDNAERKRRQAEGIKRAKESGVHFGREAKELDLTLEPGESVAAACRRLGISRQTYYRKLKEA